MADRRANHPIFSKGIPALALSFLALACSDGKGVSKDLATGKAPKKDEASTSHRGGGDATATKVAALLDKNCGECHGSKSQGGVTDISDLSKLVTAELVVPGSPNRSSLFQSMKAGRMPPSGALAAEDLALVEKWISGGALAGSGGESRTYVGEAEMQKLCAEDLLTTDAGDRPNFRYFSLMHLYDSGATDSTIDLGGQGLNKLMNSLSHAKTVKPLKAINAAKTIFRVDLRDFAWTPAVWTALTKPYPYLIVPEDGKALGALQHDTQADVPVLRGDWFLATASRAPLYYQLLGVGTNVADLEKVLGINLDTDIRSKAVIRAGFNNSTISKENRVIERHDTSNGFLWRSYEFGTSLKSQDVLANPLGPVASVVAKTPDSQGDDNGLFGFPGFGLAPHFNGISGGGGSGDLLGAGHVFTEDGGEFIFTMPNGMLGFYLAAGKNRQRLNEVPVDPGEEEIVAGLACMSCHSRGVIQKDDMVAPAAANNAALAPALALIKQLYVEASAFNGKVTKDSDSYEKKLADAGVDAKAKDPVFRLAKPYPLRVSLAQAAAELGVEAAELSDALDGKLEGVKGLFDDDAIKRSDLEANFAKMVAALKP